MAESRAMWRWTRFAYAILCIVAFLAVGFVFLAPSTPAWPQSAQHREDGWKPLQPGRVIAFAGKPLMKPVQSGGPYLVRFALTVRNESDIHRDVVLVVCRYAISDDPREIQHLPNRLVRDIKPGEIVEQQIEFADPMPVTSVWCENGQMSPNTVGSFVRAQP